jgi:parallel beta-helix repeat protein
MKSGNSFIGETGAIVSGARLLTSFQRTPQGLWFAAGQTENAELAGTCSTTSPTCRKANDVFIDDRPLRRVSSLTALTSGSFYSDSASGRIYLADDPAGHRVEVAVIGVGFRSWGVGGTVRGLVVEKFSGHGINGNITVVEGNEIRLNHGIGVAIPRGIVRSNFVHHNGQLGLGSGGDPRVGLLVENNEVSYNNYAGYSAGWQAGGGKWAKSSSVTLRGNHFHDNAGPGIWFDWDNRNIVVDGNRVEDNAREGILIEASFDVTIRNNEVRGNGFQDAPVWTLGSGILNANSTRVEVVGNLVEGNFNGIGATERGGVYRTSPGPYGLRETRDFNVHDNTIRMPRGHSGLAVTTGEHAYYTSKGNRFWNNTYLVACQKPFVWSAPTTAAGFDAFTFTQWRGFGNDAGGGLSSSCSSPQGTAPSSGPSSTSVTPRPATPTNGDFESGLAGWGRVGSEEVLTIGTAAPRSGSRHASVATTGSGTQGIRVPGAAPDRVPVTPGRRYTVAVWLRGSGKVRLRAVEYDAAGRSLGAGTVSVVAALTSAWQQRSVPVTVSASAGSLTVWIETAWPQTIRFDVDDVTVA